MKAFSQFIVCCLIVAAVTVGVRPTLADDSKSSKAQALSSLLASPDQANALSRRIDWMQTLQLEKRAGYLDILIQDDIIAILESKNILTVVDTPTGKIRWRTQVDEPITKLFTIARLESNIVVNSESNAYVYNLVNGKMTRQVPLPNVAATGPLLIGDLAVFSSPTGRVYAVNLLNGLTHWEYQLKSAMLVAPVMIDGIIIVADASGVVKALDSSGDLMWAKAGPPWKRVSAQPQASDTAVYIASEDQALYGIDRTTGNMWRYLSQKPLRQPPVVIGERVYQQIPGIGLHCFDALTGELLWNADQPGQPLMILKNQLLLSNGKDLVLAEKDNGRTIKTISLPKADNILADKHVDGNLYLFNNDGRILKLGAK